MRSLYRKPLLILVYVTVIVALFYYTITKNWVPKRQMPGQITSEIHSMTFSSTPQTYMIDVNGSYISSTLPNMVGAPGPFSSTLEPNTTRDADVENGVIIRAFDASKESKEVQLSVSNHKCVQLRTPGNSSQICVHPIESDRYISNSLIQSGIWESTLVRLVASSLNGHPDMMLLDLGCNIGVFTIYCANLKRRVVSIDANKENLLLLSRSLALNHFQDRVTLIWKAMSNVHESVILKGYAENKGGTYVQTSNETDPNLVVKTITLDDLIPSFKNESVFIKMDIETYEWNVLEGGFEFFKSVNVGYVLIEFAWHRTRKSGKKIYDFMSGFGFRPYGADSRQNQLLKVNNYPKWPDNVLWSKY